MNKTTGKKMWTWFSSWLSSFWKTAEEEIDPIGQEELEIDEVPLDENFQELPCHSEYVYKKAVFTQYSGFHVPMNFEGQTLVYEISETRASGSIYDASYKRQFELIGKDSSKFLDALVTSDIESLEEWKSVETLMTNNNGGIIDILLVSKLSKEKLRIVANIRKVLIVVQNVLKGFEGDVRFKIATEEYYFIFQGPECATYLENFFLEIENLPSLSSKEYEEDFDQEYEYQKALLTRNADTEEDGYSISCEQGFCLVYHFQVAVDKPKMPVIGFEAKECLRIEAGKCLTGYDINENITPVEADLTHLISERKKKEGGFPGYDRIRQQLKDGPRFIRRGFISEEGRLRRGDKVSSPAGQAIGFVTSAAYSPITKKFIAMGYVDSTYSNKSDDLVFNENIKGRFKKFPFVLKGEPR